MSEVSPEDRFEIFKESLKHYKNRISIENEKEENEEIKSLLDEFWKTKIELINEILGYVEKGDHKYINQQLDRYRHAMCVSMDRYLEDLKTTKSKIEHFEKNSLDYKNIEEKIHKIEQVHVQFCEEHLKFVDAKMKFATF